EELLLQRTAGPYIGSIAPDRDDRDARPMSSSSLIAVKHWHHSETPLCAKTGCEQLQQRQSIMRAVVSSSAGARCADAARTRRRGDRIAMSYCCDCSRPLMALRDISLLAPIWSILDA